MYHLASYRFTRIFIIFSCLYHLNFAQLVNIRNCNQRCENGGTCLQLGLSTAYCVCPGGFSGSLCNINLRPPPTITTAATTMVASTTQTPPTTPGATTNQTTSNQTTVASTAPPEYRNCDFPLSICENGGQCRINIQTNKISCNCPHPFLPPLCKERVPFCRNNPCLNGGTCESKGELDGECKCAEGFSGQTCNIAPCNPNPCKNGADCINVNGLNTCFCTGNLIKPFCDSPPTNGN